MRSFAPKIEDSLLPFAILSGMFANDLSNGFNTEMTLQF